MWEIIKGYFQARQAVEMVEIMTPLQSFMNDLHDHVGKCGWDVNDWTISDLDRFTQLIDKAGKGF